MKQVTVQDLLEAGCHFGHQTKRWNPKMKPYVYGAKNGISIIDITKTIRQIGDAANFLQHTVMNGGKILFVGTKRQAQQIVKEAAEATAMHFVCERWLGGTLTNNSTIRKSIAKMLDIDKITNPANATAGGSALKKKEIVAQGKLGAKLHRDLDGIVDMKRLPDVIFVVDVCHDEIAIKEAKKLGIPTVAIVDTNGDPSVIDYPIAANDDAVKSIKVVIDTLVEAIKDASELYSKKSVEDRSKIEAARAAKDEKPEDKKSRDRNAKGDRRGAPRRKPAGQGGQGGHGGHGRAPKAAAAEGAAPAASEAPKEAKPKKKAAPKAAAAEGAAEAPKAE